MVELSKFRTLVNGYVTNLPDLVFVSAFRTCLRQFLENTNAYTVSIILDVGTGQQEHQLNNPAELDIIQVVDIKDPDGKSITPTVELVSETPLGKPSHFMCRGRKGISFYPVPESDGEYTVTVAVKPSITTNLVLEDIVSENDEALRNGTLALLKMQRASEWYAPEEVGMYKQEFERLIGEKKLEIETGHNSSDSMINFPFFL